MKYQALIDIVDGFTPENDVLIKAGDTFEITAVSDDGGIIIKGDDEIALDPKVLDFCTPVK